MAKTNGKLTNEKVSVSLYLLSKAIIEKEDELEKREERIEELETVLWEGKYTDYIARALAKVKSCPARQNPANESRKDNSLRIVKKLATEPKNTGAELYLRKSSKELGISYRPIRAWVVVYATRCGSKYHHAGFDSLFHEGNPGALAQQIISDLEDIYNLTPKHLHSSIPMVQEAIRDFRD